MPSVHVLFFPPFRFDPTEERLWRDAQSISLRRKTFAVLRYLIEHAGQLITKDELLTAVWPGTVVTEGLLSGCINELRKALDDNPKAPHFIETVYGRGYRWIAPLSMAPPPGVRSQYPVASETLSATTPFQLATGNRQLAPLLVGREQELEQLYGWWTRAQNGERQLVFITGEPGIGKTTLVDAFLVQVKARSSVANPQLATDDWQLATCLIGRGQCIEHYGASEAYLPVLEALGRLCRAPLGQDLIALLRQHAPTWLIQMPSLLTDAEFDGVQRRVQGTTQERMLRELAEALEVLTAETPLVFVLEDLHWSDVSTLDLLAFLARRRELARLLVIATHRPVEMVSPLHPLWAVTQELYLHHYCKELRLGFLAEAEIAEYLSERFPLHQFPPTLAQMFYQRTEGNPLFMVGAVDFLVAQGVIVKDGERWGIKRKLEELEVGVPDNIRQMVEKQSEQLSLPDKQLLEAASVAGGEFSAAVVASAIGENIVTTEERCKRLAQQRCFLQAVGLSEWPNGTVATRYRFIHALYENLWYEQTTAAQRRRLHQRIGECLEYAYGQRAHEIAAELARHFEQGRDFQRAVQYLGQAAENSTRRYAYREAISLATTGLEFLKLLPDTTERLRQELVLQTILGISLMPTQGYTAPEVGAVYARAQELSVQLGELRRLFTVLVGLWQSATGRADHEAGHEFGKQMLALAQREQDPVLLIQARSALGTTLFFRGELVAARECLAENTVGTDSQQPNSYLFTPWFGPEISSRAMAPLVLWHLGYPDQAREKARQILALALALPDSFNRAITCFLAAVLYQEERRGQAAQGKVEEMIALCTEHEFPFFVALSTVLRGWLLTQQGQAEKGITRMRDGLVACEAVGAGIFRLHYLALLAETYGNHGQAEAGLRIVNEAIAGLQHNTESVWTAELYRVKGELTLQCKMRNVKYKMSKGRPLTSTAQAEAEEYLHHAIAIAQSQGAKTLELRAAIALARLWQTRGKKKQARKLLVEVYDWFTEGFETTDLQEAKALLVELQ